MSKQSPPKWIFRFLEWFCPSALYEGIEGDLLEEYEADVKTKGVRKAKLIFAWNVLKFFRPGIILRNKFNRELINTNMLANYMKVASRNIGKRKMHSFINAFGLSIGMAFCVLVYLFIQDEKNFDQFQDNKELIYRLHTTDFSKKAFEKSEKQAYQHSVNVPAKLGEAMLDELPEVQYMTRFSNTEYGTIRYEGKAFKEKLTFVDSGFFRMFSFPIVYGDRKNLFRNPSDAVLTEDIAKKYFGEENPIGKSFTYSYNTEQNFTVAAVIQSPPVNSSLQFQILLPITAKPWFENIRESWSYFTCPTFVQVYPNTSIENFKSNLDKLSVKYMADVYKDLREINNVPAQFKVSEFNFTLLKNIHLSSQISWDKVSDPKYSWILEGIALLILVIASINYISLALTTSVSRSREVGVRKVIGASKAQLMLQFMFESFMLVLISMILGIFLVMLFLPFFNEFTNKAIELNTEKFTVVIGMSLLLAIVIGILASGYPSLFLSQFLPVQVLKGRSGSRVKTGFTKALVGFQFFLSASLIICSIVMMKQMKYIVTRDLGYNKEQIVVVDNQAGWNAESNKAVEKLRNQLQNHQAIQWVAGTNVSFNKGWSKTWYKAGNKSDQVSNMYTVDHYYVPLLGLELIDGRNFDENFESDKASVIVNEAFVREMGWESAVGQEIFLQATPDASGHKIIGVVKDFNYQSLEHKIEPVILSLQQDYLSHLMCTMIKITPEHIAEGVELIKSAFTKLFPDQPFVYSFMEEDVANQYENYQRWMRIINVATVFAILIACLGLFGLSGVNTINRTKEIGIRKVMGAQVSGIFLLLNKQYVWLSLFAYILAIPVSEYAMSQWLSNFQFSVTIGAEFFILAIGVGLFVTVVTVSYHGIKAALINPAETLKHE